MLHLRQIPSAMSLASVHKLLAMLAADAKRAQDPKAAETADSEAQRPAPPPGTQLKTDDGELLN